MMVVYQCYGRAHTSVVAAHIHLGRIDAEIRPGINQIISLPLFDQAEANDLGRPVVMGRDAKGHEILVLGCGLAVGVVLGALHSVFDLAQSGPQVLVVNTLDGLGFFGRCGGFLSRRLGAVAMGRPLAAYGVSRIYPRLAATVNAVKRFLNEAAE